MKIVFINADPEIRRDFGLKYFQKHELVISDGKIPVASVMGFTFRSGYKVERAIVSLNVGKQEALDYVQALRQCYSNAGITVTAKDPFSIGFDLLDVANAGADELLEEDYVIEKLEQLVKSD